MLYVLVVAMCQVVPAGEKSRVLCKAERIERLQQGVCVDLKNLALARVSETVSVAAECVLAPVGSGPETRS